MRRFAFVLAKDLGYANVDEMLRGMSAKLFGEWMAYYLSEQRDAKMSEMAAKARAAASRR